ncbi:uncharacterized protein YukE [Herbihabitans rhizosphaerae]|uniref:Uncharacterized protein YukE n=1 Tax=Herbihabitans rhizosphaerae TaxID=1872711 RepID=A0A4Q7L623_9PSEU|nr:WXG100 family type VII secretion target [Herbihabitans rhizosphaerae]RZS44785.1 uncharacterized protein YukE [Herbihabitans rhizosphaerae]
MGFGNEKLQELASSGAFCFFRDVVAFLNGPDLLSYMNLIDADDEKMRDHAKALTKAAEILEEQLSAIKGATSTVKASWDGKAADEFDTYMADLDKYGKDVLARFKDNAEAGGKIADEVEKMVNGTVDYIETQIADIAWALGEVGVGTIFGGPVGAILGAATAIIDGIRRAINRIGDLNKLMDELDDATPGETKSLKPVPFDQEETGFDDKGDLEKDKWEPAA